MEPKPKEQHRRASEVDVYNLQNNPAEFYRRAFSQEDLDKKSPVEVPADADVMVEEAPPTEAKKQPVSAAKATTPARSS